MALFHNKWNCGANALTKISYSLLFLCGVYFATTSNSFFLCTHYIYTYNYISEESKMVTRFDRFPCVIVIRPAGGRLGNRMFLFASAYGLASWHMCGLHIESDLFNNLSAIFRTKLSQLKKQIIYLLKKTRYTLLISQPCFLATDNISNIIEWNMKIKFVLRLYTK